MMEEPVARYDQIDPTVEARVDDLLGRMTLAEKVGQLVQITPFAPFDVAKMEEQARLAEAEGRPFVFEPEVRADLEELIRAGRAGSIFGTADVALINRCRRAAVEGSRLGIPLVVGNDVIHGLRTVFPIPLAEASTWDPPLLEQAARVAAEEASATGTDWIFAPMVDVARDPRWGRIAEGAGEDSYLGGVMAQARVRGFQAAGLASGQRVAACPKHYVAYGGAEAGRDYNTVDISERTLRDVYLPPFKAAFDAGAGTVMSSFNEIGGVPATCNAFILTTVLRDEWQWAGMVVSDYEAVRELLAHGVAADLADAARRSILAGLDMDMVSNAYADHLAALVDAGQVPIAAVDEAVRRVLRLKIRLGLFEHPYTDEEIAGKVILRDDFREVALRVAQESMVLLKNEGGLLPLAADAGRVAVIGALADNRRELLGCWAFHGQPEDVETVLEGLGAYLEGDRAPVFVPGYTLPTKPAGFPVPGEADGADGKATLDIPAAVAAAREADVVVLVAGESADMSGEAHSRAHLGLPWRQQELLDALAATGKPLVVVLMSGRPLVIPRVAEQATALLAAWHGGIRAGRAIADILFGAVNPSGKLTASWPRTEGQIPVYYAHKNTGRPVSGSGTTQFEEAFKSTYLDVPNAPLFPFGYGLSYTTFAYRDLAVAQRRLGLDGTLEVSVVVKNSGKRAGDEVVQLYVRDLVGSVSRPVKELKAFQRVSLQPGEEQTVRFAVPVRDLGFHGLDMRYTVEPGAFKVWAGPNAAEGLEGAFEVQGD
jgi:beta-glucosidase